MLKVGDPCPDFNLEDQNGNWVSAQSLKGSKFLVWFYPKASTPGCTTEACGFRDLASEFAGVGTAILGASADSERRQANFAEKNELSYPLLSDPEHVILEPWGVWGEKKNYGRTYMGIKRSTFLLDGDGVVRHVWRNVRVKGHVDAVLKAARDL